MVAARQRAPAVAQAEQRVELLDELDGRGAPAQRPDGDAVPDGRLGRDLEDRERDVEAAAQVDVAVARLLEALVARRLERLDEAVLEHQRAKFRVRRLVVDVLGLAGPLARRREVRARPGPQADRLADVQRTSVGVAEDVDAGVLRQARDVRPRVARALGGFRARPHARGAARAQQRDRLADRARVGRQLGEQRAEHARAGHGVGQRAVHALDLDAERVGERGEPAPALQRRDAPRERDRAEDGRVGPGERGAIEGLAQHARVEARVVRHEHPPAHLRRQLGQARAPAAARRRPSPARCR